jgi:lipoprotein-anchoring transpeptidase ErfK/SrfK
LSKFKSVTAGLVLAGLLAGCGRPPSAPAPAPETGNAAKAINAAAFVPEPGPKAAPPKAYVPAIVKLEVLLDRARFSPGAIDGRFDENLRHALMAYRLAVGLKGSVALDKAVWTKLTMADPRPAVRAYVIDADDVAGPFTPVFPKDVAALGSLDVLGYTSPAEELAEAFHMDVALLQALNPGAVFKAGEKVLVADRGGDDLGADVYRVEVDHVLRQLKAYGAAGDLLATYPATVGSGQFPTPRGLAEVEDVVANPNYDLRTGKVSLGGPNRRPGEMAPGPNSPAGVVWIALTGGACGIQGTPDPAAVGRPQVRGCVRLTNWDARELARAVKPGVPVAFR